jgi:PPK2 family polyphosphate:nucleotide phosphotransferase
MGSADRFIVRPGSKPKLSKIDTNVRGGYEDGVSAMPTTEKLKGRLEELQYVLHAEGRHSVLVVLQGMDAGGKDGTIRHVVGAMNPLGTRTYAFKSPTEHELAHDFLWRVHQRVPARGELVVFNRSHYEDVLVVRVHDIVPKSVWSKRYDRINDFELNLVEAGTTVVKIFLHISKREQLERLEKRFEDPTRQWKVDESDVRDRALWSDFQKAYEDVLAKTSTKHAPWYVVPADRKWFRNLAVSEILVDTLESLDLRYPSPPSNLREIERRFRAGESRGRRRSKTAS